MEKRRYKIQLETLQDVKNFVAICSQIPAGAKCQLVSADGSQRINATSVLGVTSTIDWGSPIYLEAAADVYNEISEFIPVTGLIREDVI